MLQNIEYRWEGSWTAERSHLILYKIDCFNSLKHTLARTYTLPLTQLRPNTIVTMKYLLELRRYRGCITYTNTSEIHGTAWCGRTDCLLILIAFSTRTIFSRAQLVESGKLCKRTLCAPSRPGIREHTTAHMWNILLFCFSIEFMCISIAVNRQMGTNNEPGTVLNTRYERAANKVSIQSTRALSLSLFHSPQNVVLYFVGWNFVSHAQCTWQHRMPAQLPVPYQRIQTWIGLFNLYVLLIH